MSRCASKCSTAIFPWSRDNDRRIGNAIVWSPPIVNTVAPSRRRSVIDESMVYLGSMNLDPRSDSTNTELGIVARCPELAREVSRAIDMSRLHSSYQLRFAAGGENLEWVVMGARDGVVFSSEPEVSPFLEIRNMFVAPFVPEQLL